MQQKFGTCKECEKERPINSKQLCSDCQYFKTHNKTRFEAHFEKEKQKPVKLYHLKRKRLKTAKKQPTGEYNVFLEIWNEREHICTNCKQSLDRFVSEETGNPSAMLFSHIKSKGSRPDLRNNKGNIELLCPDCHHLYEFGSKEVFLKRKRL